MGNHNCSTNGDTCIILLFKPMMMSDYGIPTQKYTLRNTTTPSFKQQMNQKFEQAESSLTTKIQSFYYSHSMVEGGLDVMSYTTRLTRSTSLVMRFEIFSNTSKGILAQSAFIPSIEVTARIPTV